MPERFQPKTLRAFLGFLSFLALVAFLAWGKTVLVPVALAVLLTFLLAPLVRGVERLRLGRIPSVIVLVLLAAGLILGIGWVTLMQLRNLTDNLPKYTENIREKIVDLGKVLSFRKVTRTIEELKNGGGGASSQHAADTPAPTPAKPVSETPALGPISEKLPGLLDALGTAGMVLILSIFMLIQ